jgi:hypothetical protein
MKTKTKTGKRFQTSENPGPTLPGLKSSQIEEFHTNPERWIYVCFGILFSIQFVMALTVLF